MISPGHLKKNMSLSLRAHARRLDQVKSPLSLRLHSVRVHAEKEAFFLFPNDREIPTGFSLRFSMVALVVK